MRELSGDSSTAHYSLLLTLTQNTKDRGSVRTIRRAENPVSMMAQGPGPVGSAEHKKKQLFFIRYFVITGCQLLLLTPRISRFMLVHLHHGILLPISGGGVEVEREETF